MLQSGRRAASPAGALCAPAMGDFTNLRNRLGGKSHKKSPLLQKVLEQETEGFDPAAARSITNGFALFLVGEKRRRADAGPQRVPLAGKTGDPVEIRFQPQCCPEDRR